MTWEILQILCCNYVAVKRVWASDSFFRTPLVTTSCSNVLPSCSYELPSSKGIQHNSFMLFTIALWSALWAAELCDMQPAVLFWYSRAPGCAAQGSCLHHPRYWRLVGQCWCFQLKRKWKDEKFTERVCLCCMKCLFQARTTIASMPTYEPQYFFIGGYCQLSVHLP